MDLDVLNVLRQFAAGEIGPSEFRDRLYSNPGFESFLANDPNLGPANYVGRSAYLFLLECDLDTTDGVLDAHGAICDFLDRNGYEHTRTSRYADFHDLVLQVSPGWVDPDLKFVQDLITSEAGGRTGDELKEWLAGKLLEKYRYVSKPPEWIQNPCWPHGATSPLVFLGQIEVAGYFHDFASVYVFHDPATGGCQSIIQCY
jgi:hypothetical protein